METTTTNRREKTETKKIRETIVKSYDYMPFPAEKQEPEKQPVQLFETLSDIRANNVSVRAFKDLYKDYKAAGKQDLHKALLKALKEENKLILEMSFSKLKAAWLQYDSFATREWAALLEANKTVLGNTIGLAQTWDEAVSHFYPLLDKETELPVRPLYQVQTRPDMSVVRIFKSYVPVDLSEGRILSVLKKTLDCIKKAATSAANDTRAYKQQRFECGVAYKSYKPVLCDDGTVIKGDEEELSFEELNSYYNPDFDTLAAYNKAAREGAEIVTSAETKALKVA